MTPFSRGKTYTLFVSIFSVIACSTAQAKIADDFSFSGFGRVVAGILDTDEAEFKGYDDDLSLKPNSLIGLQGNYRVSNQVMLTAQGVLRSSDTADSGLEWLYLSWIPDDNVIIRLGRQRGPFFLYSDSIDVGYSYPWVNLPYQIYSGYIFPTFDGIDATWGYSTEQLDYTLQGYAGYYPGGDITIFGGTTDYELKAVYGLIAKVRHNNTELRVSEYYGNPKIIVPQLATLESALRSAGYSESADALKTEGWGTITQIGLSYDSISYFLRGEWMKTKSDIKYMVPRLEAYSLSGGIYSGDFTYHLTYSQSKTRYSEFNQEIVPGTSPATDQLYYGLEQIFSILTKDNLKTLTLGVRWDFMENVALKFDATYLDGNSGENSFYDNPQEGFDRDAMLYLVAVDWVF